ncbi:hypothetical protein T439DRAFT_381177 [Meredithblackwellia eburnea MCA 4105]
MVLETAAAVISKRIQTIPGFFKILFPVAALGVLRTYSAGFVCQERRNLVDKTFILVGAFSGPGLVLFRILAQLGCQVIALHPDPSSPEILQMVMLLRESTKNERLYAEECDILSIASIRSFVKSWGRDARKGMVGDLKARIEAIVFCDGLGSGLEGVGIGLPLSHAPVAAGASPQDKVELNHASLLLNRHAFIQLLLPVLLESARESPVRVILSLSPFYAASRPLLPDLDLDFAKHPKEYPVIAPWVAEGQASLASLALFREFQDRVETSQTTTNVPAVAATTDGTAGIVTLFVCGGFTRQWFRRNLRAESTHPHFSWVGFIAYIVLFPLLWLFAKSAEEGAQDLLLAVLGTVKRPVVPKVEDEAVLQEQEELKAKEDEKTRQEGKKIERDSGPSEITLRPGCFYREGAEVKVALLEDAGPTLGPSLWALESKRVEKFVALAEAQEKLEEKTKAMKENKTEKKD